MEQIENNQVDSGFKSYHVDNYIRYKWSKHGNYKAEILRMGKKEKDPTICLKEIFIYMQGQNKRNTMPKNSLCKHKVLNTEVSIFISDNVDFRT